jgi:methylenetetrahydrofolate dehydrogenase (NADP+)/methenyltetrahydrofolate cyclohydrolase
MIIDGKQIAAQVRAEVAQKVAKLKQETGIHTGLTVVRVGDDPASATYVRGKRKACDEAGINSVEHHLGADTTQAELLALIARLNADPTCHGILVQLPLPKQITEQVILEAIDPSKDADGFHPFNVGCLWTGKAGPRACTPWGVMRLLDEAKCDPKGKHALIIGRSNIVGKPMAAMLLERHATVTLAHSRTPDLAAEVARADILVAAIGKLEMVKGAWVKPGAVVIDVGMNTRPNGKLGGDVEFEAAKDRASAITPVPGGVGPMTIAMLLANTVELARRSAK